MEGNSEEEIKLLLGGVMPERETEMKEYLRKYTPYFSRCHDRPGFIVEAGTFGILKFTQRTMHQMWLLGFAANQALYSYSTLLAILRLSVGTLCTNDIDKIPDQLKHDDKYRRSIEAVYELAAVNDPATFSWPQSVPKPENRKPTDVEGAATFDLICMAGAYVFLHEMKHIAFSLDKNAPINPREEELECDLFARTMMLQKLDVYSKQSGYDLTRLNSKRAISISLALFFMLVVTPVECWSGTKSHPSTPKHCRSHRVDGRWLVNSQ